MKGILRLAFKLLVNDSAEFTALIVGITLAVFLMIGMTSLFAGILNKSSATVINVGAKVWVMDPAVQTIANSIGMPDYVIDADAGNSRDWASIFLAAAHHGNNLAHAIVQAARERGADLLVLGTHGRMPRAAWRHGSVGEVTDLPLPLVPEQS